MCFEDSSLHFDHMQRCQPFLFHRDASIFENIFVHFDTQISNLPVSNKFCAIEVA